MYERSAIVLERYFNNLFGFYQKINLRTIYKDYKELVEQMQRYSEALAKEDKVIKEFDEIANGIRKIQEEQKKAYKVNIKSEEERTTLFDDLYDNTALLEKKLDRIEKIIAKNNERSVELKESFIDSLEQFKDKQKERNRRAKERRIEEGNYLQIIERINKTIPSIENKILEDLKKLMQTKENKNIDEILSIMIQNGKDEMTAFDKVALRKGIRTREGIAKKEAECYLLVYERLVKLLSEIDNDVEIKLQKYQNILRDVTSKLEFLKAEKTYIIGFMDNERTAAINAAGSHRKIMQEACSNFELDVKQINNLYELLSKEIEGKVGKDDYKELYNDQYLKNIEEKEREFEKEIHNLKFDIGAIINPNYWRIEGIKNIYSVFKNEVKTKYGRDLTEYEYVYEEETKEENEEEREVSYKEDDIDDILDYNIDKTKPNTNTKKQMNYDKYEEVEVEDYEENYTESDINQEDEDYEEEEDTEPEEMDAYEEDDGIEEDDTILDDASEDEEIEPVETDEEIEEEKEEQIEKEEDDEEDLEDLEEAFQEYEEDDDDSEANSKEYDYSFYDEEDDDFEYEEIEEYDIEDDSLEQNTSKKENKEVEDNDLREIWKNFFKENKDKK